MAERIEARDSETKEWADKRSNAWHEGYQAGEAWVSEQNTGYGEPYLRYQFLLGLAQAITNHGREIAGVNFSAAQVEAQRKGKVTH
jgi:hypothetical protein